jgi:penicillin-binding protein 1C
MAAALLLAVAAIADRLAPPDVSRYRDRTQVVADRDGEVLRAFVTDDGMWRLATGVGDVDPLYLAMLIAYEDKRFRLHVGVDPIALGRATVQWIGAGHVVSGGSTLTMQVARLLEPRPRTIASKLIEMMRAAQLEARLTKDQILGLYLSLAPFGGNLEGVRAASLAYFGKEPNHLSPAEAALLVALPRSPTKLRLDRFPEAARIARDHVLDRMVEAGVIVLAEAERAKLAPVPDERLDLPFLAPHLAERLQAATPQAEIIVTTIDGDLQRAAERVIGLQPPVADPAASAAAIMVDNATGCVIAEVGAFDYFDAFRQGMVDMTRAIRSPGSALKPFIYALAFDRRLIHPETIIDDRPRRFRGYAPTNFDGLFHGDVSIRVALQNSLNVPAVAVLDRLGPVRFSSELQQSGIRLHLPGDAPAASLPIALGGVGVTLQDMAALYAGLARGGLMAPLCVQAGDGSVEPVRLVRPFAAWYVADILAGAARPLGFLETGSGLPFKTGTSYGYRDAWAIGFSPRYTVAVWVGRPDGGSCTGCIGIDVAAPLMRRLFDLLPPDAMTGFGPAPAGAVIAGNADLPPILRRFDRSLNVIPVAELGIAFPPDGVRVRIERHGDELDTLPLRADGGVPPFTWLVNGAPVPSFGRLSAGEWLPDGSGFADISVIDSRGESAAARIFVELANGAL